MAEKLSVRIELLGGDEIARQLGDIGKAGQTAFQDITKAAEKVGGFGKLDPTDVTAKLVKLGITGEDSINKIQAAVRQAGRLEQVVTGVQKLEDGFDKLGVSVDKFANRMAHSLGPLGVFARALGPLGIALGVAAASFIKFGDESAKALGQLNTEGAKLGLTAQEFDRLQKAFTKLGVPADAVTSSLEKLKGLIGGGVFRLGDIVPPDKLEGLRQFIAQLERMPDGVARTQLAMQTLGDALGGKVIAGLQTGTISAQNFAGALASVTPATQAQIVQAEKYQQSINKLDDAWTRFKAEVAAPILTPLIDWLTSQFPAIQAGIETTKQEFSELWSIINQITSTGADLIGALSAPWLALADLIGVTNERLAEFWRSLKEVVTTPIAGAWQWIVNAWNAMLAQLGFGGGSRTLAPAGGAPGHAAGGLLGGRGSGTSDSNLAWVSRGEYIVPARAVAQPGVLSVLETLRRGMGHFALGGMVGPLGIPAFAGGGMNAVTINFPGLPEITGLRASSGVVDQLRKAAAMAQVRSGGRKPSRFS